MSVPFRDATKRAMAVNPLRRDPDAAAAASTGKGYGSARRAALQAATGDADIENLEGLEVRYAKNGKLYTAKEFEGYYSTNWMVE